ncbi:MAG: type II toxin-antitoxin system RelE/ParE family toxin [Bacteroidales bacterium]|nr:type II toxin-antitoxin system RelE/ParE family toxin [Bacteroidales bacterium]
MKVIFKDTFLHRLESQIEYISLDSPVRARKFTSDLLKRIKEIPKNPFRYRKSIYFEDETIRDLIYKGYTIVFRITEESIEVFGFVKYQNEPND